MELEHFQKLVKDFEKNIIIEGVNRGRFSRKVVVSTKNCKLSRKDFGKRVGNVIDTDRVIVVDYYGYLKRSRGFIKKYRRSSFPKEVLTHMIHFASIKMEDVASLIPNNVHAMLDFPRLKNEILILRGFRRRQR